MGVGADNLQLRGFARKLHVIFVGAEFGSKAEKLVKFVGFPNALVPYPDADRS